MPSKYMKVSPTAVLSALSPSGTYDYLTYDPVGKRLFAGLQTDGLVVLPVASSGAINASAAAPVANTTRSNALVIAGKLGFSGDNAGFTGADAGIAGQGVTVINMTTLATVAIVASPNGVGVDNGVYDAYSGTVIMTRVDGSLMTFNAITGKYLATSAKVVPGCVSASDQCDPIEFPTVDGKGSLYICSPDYNNVLKLDSKTLAVVSTWSVAASGCYDPTGVAVDAKNNRLFVGCGDAGSPMVVVLDATAGTKVATVPIGRGNDGLIYDPNTARIFASSGVAGNIAVIQQSMAPESYTATSAVFTKMGARTLAYDNVTGTLFTMAPDGTRREGCPFASPLPAGAWRRSGSAEPHRPPRRALQPEAHPERGHGWGYIRCERSIPQHNGGAFLQI